MTKTLTALATIAALGALAAPALAQPAPDSVRSGGASPSANSAASAAPSAAPSTAPGEPVNPPADAATAPAGSGASTSGVAKTGLTVKDKTGTAIGQITEVKAGADGAQTVTIRMGTQTFSVATTSLAIGADSATINATQAEIQTMIKGAS